MKRIICLGTLMLLLVGCSTGKGPYYGQTIVIAPDWNRLRTAATEALVHPGTWAPIAGAMLLTAAQWDKPISNWASDHTPLFGSNQQANDFSDTLLQGSRYLDYGSVLLAPGPSDHVEWFAAKGKAGTLHLLSGTLTHELTSWAKDEIGRERPNSRDHRSLPSGHTSMATTHYLLAADALAYNLSDRSATYVSAAAVSLSALTGWARVEARQHYPSDVLAGYALGNWVAQFSLRAFMASDLTVLPMVNYHPDATMVGITVAY